MCGAMLDLILCWKEKGWKNWTAADRDILERLRDNEDATGILTGLVKKSNGHIIKSIQEYYPVTANNRKKKEQHS